MHKRDVQQGNMVHEHLLREKMQLTIARPSVTISRCAKALGVDLVSLLLVISCCADEAFAEQMTLPEVVAPYLAQVTQVKTLQARYRIVQRVLVAPAEAGKAPVRLKTPAEREVRAGLFGIAGRQMAAKCPEEHSVFNGQTTKLYLPARAFGAHVRSCGGLLHNDWDVPSSMFDRFYDIDRTPISTILEDSIGTNKFGTARLLDEMSTVGSEGCYVIEGNFDVAKIKDLAEPLPDTFVYRLYLSPKRGMQAVRRELRTMPKDRPMGEEDITRFVERDGVWLPIESRVLTYSFWQEGESVRYTPSSETTFMLEEGSLCVNDCKDSKLFTIDWPDGTQIDDQVAGTHYVVGEHSGIASNGAKSERHPARRGLLIAAILCLVAVAMAPVLRSFVAAGRQK